VHHMLAPADASTEAKAEGVAAKDCGGDEPCCRHEGCTQSGSCPKCPDAEKKTDAKPGDKVASAGK